MLTLRDSLTSTNFQEIHKFLLSTADWACVEEIALTLSHFSKLQILMQKQTISLSDFFGGWAELKLEMSKLNDNILAKRLMAQMKFREESLFNNKILNAAVFLDPRFQQFMPNKNKETAIGFLETLHRKITSIKCAHTEIVIHTNESQSNQEFEEFLNTIYEETGANDESEENNNENQPSELAAEDIRTVLKQFIGVKEPLGSSVFEYWQNSMHLKPVLYEHRLFMLFHHRKPQLKGRFLLWL